MLISDDGDETKAHKAVIAANSDVIARAFESECTEANTSSFRMIGIPSEIANELIAWMYKKNCDNLDDYADEIYEAADQYEILDLKLAASNSMITSLTIDNVLGRFKVADMHRDNELKERIRYFIAENDKDIRKSEYWKDFRRSDPELVNELLEMMLDL